ncbi:hypothetical protein [Micromonospora fulviviridis]|uniref:Uncharacterized protein n=1 Tax=Micromonospora fulviviridis TaxID=47860 RepID=A0ABV2VPY1_9ACTN
MNARSSRAVTRAVRIFVRAADTCFAVKSPVALAGGNVMPAAPSGKAAAGVPSNGPAAGGGDAAVVAWMPAGGLIVGYARGCSAGRRAYR